MGTVFARLKVPSPDGSGALDDHGVHAFIVPLRDDSGTNMPGVEIRDCGYKVRQCSAAALQGTWLVRLLNNEQVLSVWAARAVHNHAATRSDNQLLV